MLQEFNDSEFEPDTIDTDDASEVFAMASAHRCPLTGPPSKVASLLPAVFAIRHRRDFALSLRSAALIRFVLWEVQACSPMSWRRASTPS